MTKTKVMLAMSGGVDSSAAVAFLQESGYEVCGITMFLGDETVVDKAKACADFFGIRHYAVDLTKEFATYVKADFVNEYKAGRTPNPCVTCNKNVKMGRLFELAAEIGFDYFATGHYATVAEVNGRYAIGKAKYLPKDQSYVLYTLGQDVVSRLLFPLGDMEKAQVRAKAKSLGMAVAEQSDSQDICFIPSGDYRGFLLEQGFENLPGDFVDVSGKVLGQHQGIANYTVGQRKGLGISFGHPMFVVAIKPQLNQVVLGLEADLLTKTMTTRGNNFMLIPELVGELPVEIKVRYKSAPVAGIIRPSADGLVEVTFDNPEKAITPGQSAVFYQGDLVVGGGIIV